MRFFSSLISGVFSWRVIGNIVGLKSYNYSGSNIALFLYQIFSFATFAAFLGRIWTVATGFGASMTGVFILNIPREAFHFWCALFFFLALDFCF
jgi:hypothetical protein